MSPRLLPFGLCLLPLIATADPSVSSEQDRLLSELRSCLNALPRRSASTVVSPCAEKDVRLLSGIARVTILAKLGRPDWCSSSQEQFMPWSEQACASAPAWGYSFYRIPAVGGGPELQVDFSSLQVATAFKWVHTQ
jgi:hypothetical protein